MADEWVTQREKTDGKRRSQRSKLPVEGCHVPVVLFPVMLMKGCSDLLTQLRSSEFMGRVHGMYFHVEVNVLRLKSEVFTMSSVEINLWC